MSTKRIGVVLFQLGGPDSLEAIEPFLYNLFCDPEIIDFPLAKVGRPLLAKFISKGRSRKVRSHYAEIGGGSPIRKITEKQAAALEQELRKSFDARVFVAMRYWRPFTNETIEKIRLAGCDELVLLPLYPQYSSTTSGSSLNEWRRRCAEAGCSWPTKIIRQFHAYGPYIDSVVEQINRTLGQFRHGPHQVHFVFSAHSVPVSVIETGDPYQRQIEETTRLVLQRGRWSIPATICYQSKVGNRKWLQPTLQETIGDVARLGVKNMLVVPIAFVSDHVETLSEINIEARELAAEHGIEQFEMMPGLNDQPSFIQALASLVFGTVEAHTEPARRAATGAGSH